MPPPHAILHGVSRRMPEMVIKTSTALEITRGGLADQELWIRVENTIGALNAVVCKAHGAACLAEIPYNALDRDVTGWGDELRERRRAWEVLKAKIDARFAQFEEAATE